MRVDRGITGSSRERFTFDKWDMTTCFRINVPFRKTKIDDIDGVEVFGQSDQEVVRFDVAVNKLERVHTLDTVQLTEWHRMEQNDSEIK